MIRRSWLRHLVLAAIVGCGGRVAVAPPPSARLDRGEVGAAREAAEVAIDLRSPTHVRWVPATLAPSKPTLGIVVTNRGSAPLDVSNLRVRLQAIREEVSFRCAEEVGAAPGAREPEALAVGATFVFERTLDCGLPLVGSYAIHVGVSFGHGSWAAARDVHSFSLRVFATPEIEPRSVEPIPGLWGALGATSVMEGGQPGRSGRLVVALVNGGRTPLELPRFRLVLRVYRVGSPIPCEDAPIDLHAPAVLAGGESYHEPIVVSCLGLGVAGRYEVAGRLEIGGPDDGWQVELGRLRVEIANEPLLAPPHPPR
jgi:hypothetical protein